MKTKHSISIGVGLFFLGLLIIVLTANESLFKRTPKVYFASGGSATVEKVKTPLMASISARQRARVVTFSLRLSDAGGKKISRLRFATGSPKRPIVEVFNTLGKRVYTCTLEYG